MLKRPSRILIFALSAVILTIGESVVFARADTFLLAGTEFPQPTIAPNIQTQQADNWCGAASMQAAIQWIRAYPNRTPVPGATPTAIPQAELWAYMRDLTCSQLGGSDTYLTGKPVGDGHENVRKLNLSYDFGADPHALAWTMWVKTPSGYYYHYYIYTIDLYDATSELLFTLERYHEPVLAAVWSGSHWVLVTGYKSQYPAYPSGAPGIIYEVKIANPSNGAVYWYTYSDWAAFWFTQYTDTRDPDPATGCNVPPPDHWRNHWVTVERDSLNNFTADWAILDGDIYSHCKASLPIVVSH